MSQKSATKQSDSKSATAKLHSVFLKKDQKYTWGSVELLLMQFETDSMNTLSLTFNKKWKQVEFYVETKSIVQTHRQYQCHFAVRKTPDRKTIWRILKKFQTDRTIYNVNKRDLDKPEEPELQKPLTLSACLLFKVRKSFVNDVG